MPGRGAAAIGRRAAVGVLAAAFTAVVLAPHAGRLAHPSLFCDDLVRVEQVRTLDPAALLIQPFNEHLAPLFQAVTLASWHLAGRRLSAAPAVFTAAALVPSALALIALMVLVRREVGSLTAALAALAAFGLMATDLEVAWWYSASSFAWALLATLVAWLGAARGGRRGAAAAALAAALAPAGSAIGLLAGPVGAARGLVAPCPGTIPRIRRWAAALVPLAGTGAYLAPAALLARYGVVVAESVHRHADPAAGLLLALRAPAAVLVPGLVGLRDLDRALPAAAQVALGLAGLLGVLAWAARDRRARPIAIPSTLLILGGYLLTYTARATFWDPHHVLATQRYHLFPRAGLILLLAAAVGRLGAARRLDARPAARLTSALALACLLALAHRPAFVAMARYYRFPDQPAALAALEHMEAACTRVGATAAQARAAFDPVRVAWLPVNGLTPLIVLAPDVPAPKLPDSAVRPTLLAALTPGEREALCGTMDATAYLRPAPKPSGASREARGRLVRTFRVRPTPGPPGGFVAVAAPAYLEFDLPAPSGPIRSVSVPATAPAPELELWWSPDGCSWSPTRSVRWRCASDAMAPDPLLPLDRLPHWDPARARRLRLVVRAPGPLVVRAPRLLR